MNGVSVQQLKKSHLAAEHNKIPRNLAKKTPLSFVPESASEETLRSVPTSYSEESSASERQKQKVRVQGCKSRRMSKVYGQMKQIILSFVGEDCSWQFLRLHS